MSKYRTLGPGDGTTGPTGEEVRLLINDFIPENTYIVPTSFSWTGDLSTYADRVLEIKNPFNLAGSNITLPSGCTLVFNGGNLLNVGTLTGNKSRIYSLEYTQIFSTTMNFAGTWIGGKLTPQNFGAVCSPNSTTLEAGGAIDSREAIQKVLDSPFEKHFPMGFYYRKGTANIIDKPITVTFGGDLVVTRQSGYSDRPDHVHFYSDSNNPFFEIRSSEVYMRGFTCDVRQCAAYTSAAVLAKGDYRIWGGEIDMSVIDNVANCRVATGGQGSGVPVTDWVGAKGFHWITETVSTDWGYICDAMINITTQNVAYPIIIEEAEDSPATGTWTTTMRVMGTWVAYRSFYLGKCSASKLEAVMQTGYTIPIADKNTIYSGFINDGWTVDLVPWDLTGSESGGYAYSALGLIIGDNVILTGKSLQGTAYNWFRGGKPKSTPYIDNDSSPIILRERWSNRGFNSYLDNTLIGFVQQGNSYSMTAYDGATIDFDTDLDEGTETPTANITITGAANLFTFEKPITSENNPPRWQFGAGADLDKDFVELVLNASVSNIVSNFLHLFLYNESSKPKRIQVIVTNTSDVKTVYEVYIPNSTTHKMMQRITTDKTLKKVVIRFIGATNTTGITYLMDVANQNNHRNNIVYWYQLPKRYRAYLTQTGTNAPTAVVDSTNYLSPTLQYVSTGKYRIYSYGSFKTNKSFPLTVTRVDRVTGNIIILTWVNENYYEIDTLNSSGVAANGILSSELFDIEVIW